MLQIFIGCPFFFRRRKFLVYSAWVTSHKSADSTYRLVCVRNNKSWPTVQLKNLKQMQQSTYFTIIQQRIIFKKALWAILFLSRDYPLWKWRPSQFEHQRVVFTKNIFYNTGTMYSINFLYTVLFLLGRKTRILP